MEDQRVIWMKERVYAALGLQDDRLFGGLLQRDGKRAEKELLAFLEGSAKQYSPALIFYPLEGEVEEEVEVVEGQHAYCHIYDNIRTGYKQFYSANCFCTHKIIMSWRSRTICVHTVWGRGHIV